jgi:hypothetical protein
MKSRKPNRGYASGTVHGNCGFFTKKTKRPSMKEFYNPYGLMQEAEQYHEDLTDEERLRLCVAQVIAFFAALGVADLTNL